MIQPETMERRVKKSQCPYCRSKKIEPWCDARIQCEPVTLMDDGCACVDMKCMNCEKTYEVFYKLDFCDMTTATDTLAENCD